MYVKPINVARQINLGCQRGRIQLAVKYYKIWEQRVKAQGRRSPLWPPSQADFLISPFEKVIEYLGDALHIAQDRGSHWEGAMHMGHRDPRCEKGWDPDDPKDNRDGYIRAMAYTTQAMQEFVDQTCFPALRFYLAVPSEKAG
jgi:hypothetical protein